MVSEATKSRVKRILPGLIKATVLSVLFYAIVYAMSSLLAPVEAFFPLYRPFTDVFTVVFIILLFAAELSRGTIFHYICSLARTLAFILYMIYVLDGGVLALAVPIYGRPINVVVNLTAFLAILLCVLVLGLAKNVLEIVGFLSRKGTGDQAMETAGFH
jgi:hypothetical protein